MESDDRRWAEHRPGYEESERGDNADEVPEHRGGGSDSRANWVYPGDPGHSGYSKPKRTVEPRETVKPLTTLEKIGLAAVGLTAVGFGVYYAYQAWCGS